MNVVQIHLFLEVILSRSTDCSHVTSTALFLSAHFLRGRRKATEIGGGDRASHPFKNNWDIAERGKGEEGVEERGIKKEKEERDREGREERERARDKKRKMTSCELKRRGGAAGCGRARVLFVRVTAWILQRGFDKHPIGLSGGSRKKHWFIHSRL